MSSDENFDVFISYNWQVKDSVKRLYNKLKNEYKYKVWIDDAQLDSRPLFDQLAQAISKSKVIVCCITKKYTESVNCIREITFASETKKPLVVLMFERLMVNDMGSVGFIVSPLTRFNCYSDKNIFNDWSGDIFESFLKSVNNYLTDSSSGNDDPHDHSKPVNDKKSEDKQHTPPERRKTPTGDPELDMLNEAIRLEPDEPLNYVYKSRHYVKQKKYIEAIESAGVALDLSPQNELALNELAYANNEIGNEYYSSKEYDLALSRFNKAIEYCPKEKYYYCNKAGTLNNLQRYEEAFDAANQALDIDPDYQLAKEKIAFSLSCLANKDLLKKNYDSALKKYVKAIELNPDEIGYYSNTATVLNYMHHYEEAIKFADVALKKDHSNVDAIENKVFSLVCLAKAASELNNFNDSLKCYNKAIELNPKDKVLYFSKAGVLSQLKNYPEALNTINIALQLDSSYENAIKRKSQILNLKALNYGNLGKLEHALKLFDEAIELDPLDKILFFNKANVLFNLKKYADAIQNIDISLKIDPGFTAAKEKKALYYNSLAYEDSSKGYYEKAILKYNTAIKLDPEEKVYYSNKCTALMNLKSYNEALETIDRALSIDPDYQVALEKKAHILNLQAISLAKNGNHDLAAEKYSQAIVLNPKEKTFYTNKANSLIYLQKYTDAMNMINFALKIDPNYQRAKEVKEKVARMK